MAEEQAPPPAARGEEAARGVEAALNDQAFCDELAPCAELLPKVVTAEKAAAADEADEANKEEDEADEDEGEADEDEAVGTKRARRGAGGGAMPPKRSRGEVDEAVSGAAGAGGAGGGGDGGGGGGDAQFVGQQPAAQPAAHHAQAAMPVPPPDPAPGVDAPGAAHAGAGAGTAGAFAVVRGSARWLAEQRALKATAHERRQRFTTPEGVVCAEYEEEFMSPELDMEVWNDLEEQKQKFDDPYMIRGSVLTSRPKFEQRRTQDVGEYDWGQQFNSRRLGTVPMAPPLEKLRLLLRDPGVNHVIVTRYKEGDIHHIPLHSDKQEHAPDAESKGEPGDIVAGTKIYNVVVCDNPRCFQMVWQKDVPVKKKVTVEGKTAEQVAEEKKAAQTLYQRECAAMPYAFDQAMPSRSMMTLTAEGNWRMLHGVRQQPGWHGTRYSIVFRTIKDDTPERRAAFAQGLREYYAGAGPAAKSAAAKNRRELYDAEYSANGGDVDAAVAAVARALAVEEDRDLAAALAAIKKSLAVGAGERETATALREMAARAAARTAAAAPAATLGAARMMEE